MRLAILSDMHGNPIALDAVLDDIAAQGGVDSYWFNGDYAALGFDPLGVLERITAIENAVYTRGNTDRSVASETLAAHALEAIRSDPARTEQMIDIVQGFSWTRGYISAGGWVDWLAGLPVEQRWTLPDGTRMLVVHASPGRDDGPGFTTETPTADMITLLDGCKADLVIVGHTHQPVDRTVNGIRVINPGSVSNTPPDASDKRAAYILLDADSDGYRVEFRRVAYDRAAAAAAFWRSRLPASSHVVRFFNDGT